MNDRALKQFIDEGFSHINSFEAKVLELEKNTDDAECLQSLYRSMHTIKGSAGFLSFKNLESTVHKTENIFNLLIKTDNDQRSKNINENNLISLFLKIVDNVKGQLDSIKVSKKDRDASAIIEELEFSASKLSGTATDQNEPTRERRPRKALNPLQLKALKKLNINTDALVEKKSTLESKIELSDNMIISLESLESLSALNTELILARNYLGSILDDLDLNNRELDTCFHKIDSLTQRINHRITKTRLQPISTVLDKLKRVTRDLAEEYNKKANLRVEGDGIQVDRTVLEALNNLLIHVIRNCIDHGIELPEKRSMLGKDASGKIEIEAKCIENKLLISISDDGQGIDQEQVVQSALRRGFISEEQVENLTDQDICKMIFLPNFSSKAEVSNLSGRGIGLDIVKENLNRIGGSIEVYSKPGLGTTFDISVPLSLAMTSALIVEVNQQAFAIPQIQVKEIYTVRKDLIQNSQGTNYIEIRDESFELINAKLLFNKAEHSYVNPQLSEYDVLVVNTGFFKFALAVDNILDLQEIVIKKLPKEIKPLAIYSGSTILPDGKLALIIDPEKLYTKYMKDDQEEGITIKCFSDSKPIIDKVVSFRVAGHLFGIDYSKLREISLVKNVIGIPGSNRKELMNLRNEVILVKKLGAILGLGNKKKLSTGIKVVLNHHKFNIALSVDDVSEIIKITNDMEPLEEYNAEFSEYIHSIYDLGKEKLYILNDHILD